MAEVIWQNTFDGTSGAVTTVTSGFYGDPLAFVSGATSYTQAQRSHGSGAMQVGTTDDSGTVQIEADYTLNWGGCFYIHVPVGGYLTVALNSTTIIELDDDRGIYRMGSLDVAQYADDLIGRWIRVYVRGYEISGSYQNTVGVRWTEPIDQQFPVSDQMWAWSTGNVQDVDYIEITSGGFDTPPAFVDSVRLWKDIDPADSAVPAPYEVGSDTLLENTLDGPDGTTITTTNSGDYGDPASFVQQGPTYSDAFGISGDSSARLVGTGASNANITWNFTPSRAQWSVRFYALVPGDGRFVFNPNGTGTLTISPGDSNYAWSGEDISTDAANLVDQPLRVEMLVVDYTATLRIWWTDIHSNDNPDLEETVDTSSWGPLASVQFQGGNNTTEGAYVSDMVFRQGEWIGPIDYIPPTATAEVAFSGTAVGTPDIGGFVQADVAYDAEASAHKSVEVEVAAQVNYSGEVEHDAREIGLASGSVVYDGEVEGTTARIDVAETDIEYVGEVDWQTGRSGEGSTDVTYQGAAQGESRLTLPDVTRVGLRYRLVAYDPNGQSRGQIPLPLNFALGVPLNDLPSLSLEYLRSAPGYEYLDSYCEVAVELAPLNSQAFGEYPGMRFINIRSQGDSADRTGNMKFTMPHYGWQLRKARIITGLNTEEQRTFTNATFGQIMHTLLSEAQSRGWNPGMSWDFTPQRDSAGQVWDDVYTIAFDAGQDLWTILDTFSQQHACDFQFHRRMLRMFNADTALNRNRANQAVLHLGRDISSAPNDWSSEELASRVHVRGDDLRSITMTVPNAQQPWGQWETYIKQSGVTDYGTLNKLGSWMLEKARQPLVQMTRGILFPTAQYIPFRDYQPGDYITAPGDVDSPFNHLPQRELRVQQITLTSSQEQGMEGALVLNERFIENALRRDRILNALTGGAGSNPGGGGGGTPPREDTRTPRAPQGLVVGSDTFINEIGEPRGQITASWAPVTEATNGTEMDISAYEVFIRWAAFGETFSLRTTVDHPDTTAFMSPFDPDEVYEVRVRAVGRNQRRSAFSSTVPVFVDRDAEAPDIPSTPILDSRLGVVRVTWDGLSVFGTPMDLDFDYVAVWMSETASEEDGWERVDTLYRQGVSAIPDLPYDTEIYFRFTAVDRSNNESEPSAMASISVQQLVPGDITPGSIGYELLAEGAVRDDILADDAVRNRHIAAGEVTGEKIRAYSIFADRIAVGNTRNLLTDPKHTDGDLRDLRLEYSTGEWEYRFDSVTQQDAPMLARVNNANGTYQFHWIQSVDAESIVDPHGYISVAAEMGRLVSTARVTVSGITSGTVVVGIYARFLDRQGNEISGEVAVISPVTYQSTTTDDEITSNNGAGIPEEAAYALVFAQVIFTATNENTWVRISRPFAALTNGQVLIENGAVSANKIAANAITADKIDVGAVTAVAIAADAITTDKLAANAITAKHTITGALIQTTAQANRGLKITSTGLQGFDNVGNTTFSYSSATGVVRTTGRFQTGVTTGNNLVLDANLYAGRPAVQFNTGNSSALQPVMYAMGAESSDYRSGSLLIHGRETRVNDTGRQTLQLYAGNGSGASLSQEYGSYSGIGVFYENWFLGLRGRVSSGTTRLGYMLYGRSTASTSYSDPFTASWTFTYGSPAPNGGRLVQATAYTRNVLIDASANVVNNYLGSSVIRARKPVETSSSYSIRVQYYILWTETGWNTH